MPLIRSQIIRTMAPGDPVRDEVVSDVWHTIASGGFNPSTDYQNHANELRDLFSGSASGSGSTFQAYSYTGITVKVYDMTDTVPRVPRATASFTPSTWGTGFGPRESACCLSFYATNPSIKRQRGRIYIGPFNYGDMHEHVPDNLLDQILDLGHGLFDIGGENVAHVVWSRADNAPHVIQHYWVNSSWDVQRSRDTKEVKRVTLAP